MSRRLTAALAAAALAVAGAVAGSTAAGAAPVPDLTFTTTGDAYVQEASPTVTEGATDPQNCKVDDDLGTRRQCLVSFTVAGLGAGDTVTAARVLLNVKGNSTPPKPMLLSTVTGTWAASSVTWNNRPALGSQVASQGTLAFKQDAVFALAAGTVTGNGSYSFAVTADPGTLAVGTNFYASENTDGQPGPRLVVSVDHQSPPVAVLTQPAPVNEDTTTTLTAIDSTDPDGDIVSYSWDFGDGTPPVIDAGWWFIDHTYANPGSYPVTVTVRDSGGRTSSDTKTIVVNNVADPPVAALTVTPGTAGTVPFTVTANASGSTDPDGDIATYAFNWGDGSTVTGPQAGATATHTYNRVGSYTVTVTVTDATSLTGSATATATTTARFPGDAGAGYQWHGLNNEGTFGAVESHMPHPFGGRRDYNGNNWGVPNTAVAQDIAAGRVPMISWKFAPYTVSTVPQSAINQACTDLASYAPHTILAAIYHEPTGDIVGTTDRAAYRALQRNTILTCRSMGVTNVAWMSPLFEGPFAFTTGSGHSWSELYADCLANCSTSSPTWATGSARVYDLDGVDIYVSRTIDSRPFTTQMGVVTSAMTAAGLTPLPWAIGELGVHAGYTSGPADLSYRTREMQAAWDAMRGNPAYVAVDWWNTGGESFCHGATPASDQLPTTCAAENILAAIMGDSHVVRP